MQSPSAEPMVRYATADSPLGMLLVAMTGRGICHIALGDAEDALVAELTARFAGAELVRDHGRLSAYVAEIVAYLGGSARSGAISGSIPVDVEATAFEARVWRALQDIPPGTTRTYGEIAAAIGAPGAARAVGRACGANPVAIVIPCHRAVGVNGKLTGYRWGIERKRRLLALEAKIPGRAPAAAL